MTADSRTAESMPHLAAIADERCPVTWCRQHPAEIPGVHLRRVEVGRMSVELEDAGDGPRVFVDVQERLEAGEVRDLASALIQAAELAEDA